MQEILELLLPDAGEDRFRTSLRWTSFMRLLCDDARSGPGERVGIDRSGALGVFDDHAGEALKDHLVELLRAHLLAHFQLTGRGGFLARSRDARTPQDGWSALEEFRHEQRRLATIPGPGESALSVARRLFASLEELAPDDPEVAVWRARLRMAGGPSSERDAFSAPERPLLALLQQAGERRSRAALLAGCVELMLERGAVRAASALLSDHAELSLEDDRLLELRSLSSLLCGDLAEARALRAARAPGVRRLPARTVLPDALAELRERVPEWSEWLAGDRQEGPATPSAEALDVSRGAVGAAFLAIFRIEAGGALAARHVEISPGWRKRFEAWSADREGVCSSPSRAEHRLVATACPQIEHRLPARPALRGALGGEETLALALWPLFDARGEIAGWVHFEFEHHLVPSRRRLESLSHAWGPLTEPEVRTADPSLDRSRANDELTVELRPEDPRAAFFAELVALLGMKSAQRRWWGIVCDGERRAIVVSDGGTLDRWEARRGRARILQRSLLSGGPVVTTEPDPSLSISAEAASGVCLPLRIGGTCGGFLVVEGERRRDFRAEDVDRYARVVGERASLLRVACFRSWHGERFGNDLHFDLASEGFGRRALDFALAGRTGEPVVLSGPRGAGKATLSHWLHFESPLRDERVAVLRAAAILPAEAEQVIDGIGPDESSTFASRPGTLVVKDVPALSRAHQGKLLRALEEGLAPRPRLVFTLLGTLDEAAASGALLEGLAHRLDRLQLLVPPLAERREELPGLVRLLGNRFAVDRGVPAPQWDDEALALLWRQPWPGNVRQLENLVYKLVLLHPGNRIGADDVRDLARRFRMELLHRIPSRHPSRHDLLAALHTTRKQSGNPNKTRAALYLGWDPDTLATRLREAGLWTETSESAPAVPGESVVPDSDGRSRASED